MLTRTASRPRTDLRTTATPSRAPSPLQRLRARSLPTTRRSSRTPLRRHSSGSTQTFLPRRRSLKRSKSLSRELPCLSFSPWLEPLVELQVVCRVVCQVLVECLTSVPLVEPALLLPMILLPDQPLRKSTKLLELISIRYSI